MKCPHFFAPPRLLYFVSCGGNSRKEDIFPYHHQYPFHNLNTSTPIVVSISAIDVFSLKKLKYANKVSVCSHTIRHYDFVFLALPQAQSSGSKWNNDGCSTTFWFHCVNLSLHCCATVLLHCICEKHIFQFKSQQQQQQQRQHSNVSPATRLTVILFALHPIHTEAVSCIPLCHSYWLDQAVFLSAIWDSFHFLGYVFTPQQMSPDNK